MAYAQLPTRTTSDTNSAADINQLEANIEALKGGTASVAPTTTIEGLASSKATASATLTSGKVLKGNGTNALTIGTVNEVDIVSNSTGNASAIGNILVAAGTDKTAKDSGYPSAGIALQQVVSVVTTKITGSTTIPSDNTIPQNTEGNEIVTVSITPKLSSSKLHIHFTGSANQNTPNILFICALFIDNTANALCVNAAQPSGNNFVAPLTMQYQYTNTNTNAKTFKIRVGSNTAGTITVNGISGSDFFGGVWASTLTVTEYAS